jgi:hypothetical protein
MAIVAPQEEASSDDVLVWRYAGERARQAAEAARARAREAAAEASERRGLRSLGPTLERAVRSVRIQRNPARHRRPGQPSPEVWATPAAEAPDELPARERLWTPEPPRVVSLDDILADGATIPLPSALLVYDDVLEWLQRCHASGSAYGGLDAGAVTIDSGGRCSLGGDGAWSAARDQDAAIADLEAATAIFTKAIAGRAETSALPLPARCLVEQAQAVNSASARLSAGRLRLDLAVAARAFLDEGWEIGARTWLGSASAAAAFEQADGRLRPADGGEATASRRSLLVGVAKRDPRMVVGLGIAAGASVALVVGAAVGLTGSHTPASSAAHPPRPAITTPAPVANPTAAAGSATLPQPTPAAAPPAPPTAVATAPPAAPPPMVERSPAPVAAGPVQFTPVAAPPPPSALPSLEPTPAPTPAPNQCILSVLCP